MATIKSELDYIQEARSQLAEALITKFGVRRYDNAKDSPTLKGLWTVNADKSPNKLKRLYDWAELVTGTNVHTDASLTFKNDGKGDAAGTTFNGSVARSISYNSIGAAPAGHTHTTTIATSTDASLISLAYGGKYKLTAGGTSYVFTMPASDNTNTAHTTFTWTGGTTAGPTGTLSGNHTAVAFPAIPTASASASGIVTTGALIFAGSKTFNAIVHLLGNQYTDSAGTGSLNLNNSDIYGVNSIKFSDLSDGAGEGLQWYRDSTHVDSIWVNNGSIYFTPNREWGKTATNYIVAHTGNGASYFTALGNSSTGWATTTVDVTIGGLKRSVTVNYSAYANNARYGYISDSNTARVMVSTGTGWSLNFYRSSATIGSSRQLTYLNTGTITAGNYVVSHYGNAGKSNMNDVGRMHASSGMTNLAAAGNTTDNPYNGSTESTSWHLYWSTNYSDNPNGSNSWTAQIANKAGTDLWWVRSRSGGTITNGTAWASGWRHLVTSSVSGVGGSTTPVYINANGEVIACAGPFTPASHNHDGRYLRWNGSAANVTAMGWGTLTSANGYTILSHAASSDGGDMGFVNKGGKIFMLLDGQYYQNEGRYRVLDTSDFTTFSNAGSLTTRITIGGVTKDLKIDADTIDGYHASNISYPAFHFALGTIDLTEAAGFDRNTYYPCTISAEYYLKLRIHIWGELSSNTPSVFTTHDSGGFAMMLDWETNAYGWGTISIQRKIHLWSYNWISVNPCAGIGQLSNSSVEYVYLRGGAKYRYWTSTASTITPLKTTYTVSSLSVSPTTSVSSPINARSGSLESVSYLYCSEIQCSGNSYAAHFYENSDIRYKLILNNLFITTKELSELPLFNFKWIENNYLGTGTSAQAVQEILPNLVSGTDKLTLDYGVLGTIAGITACKELVNLKSEIDLLKERIKELELQLKMINDYGRC